MAENPNIVSQTQAGPRASRGFAISGDGDGATCPELKRKAPESRRWV